jgi:hypothetical protein
MRLGWIGIAAITITLMACGQSTAQPAASTSVVAAPQPSPSPCSIPQPLPGLCVGRAATASEQKAMLAVGSAGILADWGYKDWPQCSTGQNCFKVSDPPQVMVGTNAGVYSGGYGVYPGGGLGAACSVFLSKDLSGAWHYATSACYQNSGYVPGPEDHVSVSSGCANVRSSPGLSSKLVACLTNYTQVDVDSAPVFVDSYIWWHLAGRGWMANDFLIALKPSKA